MSTTTPPSSPTQRDLNKKFVASVGGLLGIALLIGIGNSNKSQPPQATEQNEPQFVTVQDLLLDGRKLARAQARVTFSGQYYRDGNLEMVFGSGGDMLRSTGAYGHVRDTSRRLIVNTDDASRKTREWVLSCGQKTYGCSDMTLTGHMTMCTIQNGFGAKHEEPCLAAD
jgi:hypothetical protein